MDDAATTLIVARAFRAAMDSTKDRPRPGSRGDARIKERNPTSDLNATGSNAGPDRRAAPASEDAPRGTTSQIEPELRGKPERGSRLSSDS